MNQRQVLLMATLSSVFTLLIIAGSLLIFSQAVAAPPTQPVAIAARQASVQKSYVSVSALGFMPTKQAAERYGRYVAQQLLVLRGQDRNFEKDDSNLFWMPLSLPDHSRLTGMKVFGVDRDAQGYVQVDLVRCDHSGKEGCTPLYWVSSDTAWQGGDFEISRPGSMDTIVDNNAYTYLLNLRITALSINNVVSGLRSVRLELELPAVQSPPLPPTPALERGKWKASRSEHHKIIQRLSPVVVEFCSDSYGATVLVDGKRGSTVSRYTGCIQEAGTVFEVVANGDSAEGTYRIVQ